MTGCSCHVESTALERQTLRVLLVLNGAMFLVEAIAGWISQSTGLLADSLDMFADAAVYGTALVATGKSEVSKLRSAKVSGILQMALGAGVMLEVARRLALGSEPLSGMMIAVGLLALTVNVSCLCLLAKHRRGEVHMRATWIFSTNDVIANVGVILSGLLVMFFENRFPDLVIGGVVSVLVIRGGILILREAACHGGSAPTPSTNPGSSSSK